MKQSDKIAIILIGMVGIGVSWIGVNQILGNPDDAQVTFKTIEVISADLDTPDPEVFNADAINPTVEVYIGSCEDTDGDGVLSQAENVACGRAKNEKTDEENEENEVKPTAIPTPAPTANPVPSLAPTMEPEENQTRIPESTENPELEENPESTEEPEREE